MINHINPLAVFEEGFQMQSKDNESDIPVTRSRSDMTQDLLKVRIGVSYTPAGGAVYCINEQLYFEIDPLTNKVKVLPNK